MEPWIPIAKYCRKRQGQTYDKAQILSTNKESEMGNRPDRGLKSRSPCPPTPSAYQPAANCLNHNNLSRLFIYIYVCWVVCILGGCG